MSYNSVGQRGTSKASATTTCQKCLKRGHYSFECKAPAQERPYVSRPSRSQQFLNPKLRPALTNETLKEETNKPMQVNRAALSRGSLQKLEAMSDFERPGRKRSHSLSTGSSVSVATISTRNDASRSRSRSRDAPKRKRGTLERDYTRRNDKTDRPGAKRRRSTSSRSTDDAMDKGSEDRNIRMRKRSTSPEERGRRQHRRTQEDHDKSSYGHDAQHSRAKQDGNGQYEAMQAKPSHVTAEVRQPRPAARDRSLSPYSKRVALSQMARSGG